MTTEATTYPPLIGTPPACEMMGGISRSRLYILKDEGKIDSVKEGKRRMWVTDSIYAYIESLEHSQSGNGTSTTN